MVFLLCAGASVLVIRSYVLDLLSFKCSFMFQVILALGDFMNVQCHACIGGTNLGEDIRKLDYGQHVVSGTPGRVFGTSFRSSLIMYSPIYNIVHTVHKLKQFS